jgi:signal transduction histidine kinase
LRRTAPAWFRHIFASNMVGIGMWAGDGSIAEANDRLARLTRDLLDISRIQTGQLVLRPGRLDLVDLIERVAAPYRASLAPHHRLRLDLPTVPGPVMADGERLTQVLTNLLDNAFKYSPQGGEVSVVLRRQDPPASLGAGPPAPLGTGPAAPLGASRPAGSGQAAQLIVRVADEGIGVPAGSLEAIFQPFARAPNARESPMPGMGLGLFVCRSIVERHGGRMWAESPGEGQGTTVSFVLPADGAAGQT